MAHRPPSFPPLVPTPNRLGFRAPMLAAADVVAEAGVVVGVVGPRVPNEDRAANDKATETHLRRLCEVLAAWDTGSSKMNLGIGFGSPSDLENDDEMSWKHLEEQRYADSFLRIPRMHGTLEVNAALRTLSTQTPYLDVQLSLQSPSGQWYFRCNDANNAYHIPQSDIPLPHDAPSLMPPGYGSEEDTQAALEHAAAMERPAFTSYGAFVGLHDPWFRQYPNDQAINPVLEAFGKALAEMPKLKRAELQFKRPRSYMFLAYAAPGQVGRSYVARAECEVLQIQPSQGCHQLAEGCGITSEQLIAYNPKDSLCTTLRIGQRVCCTPGDLPPIRNNPDGSCKEVTLTAGMDCDKTAAACGVSLPELHNFNNKTQFELCSNLKAGTATEDLLVAMRFSLVALVVSATAVLAAPAPESNANHLQARAIICDRTTKNNCPADCLASYHGTQMNCAKSVASGGADADGNDYGTSRPSLVPHDSDTGTFKRNLGVFDAFGIIISIVIGSGVFTSPGAIDSNVPSPAMALVIWVLGAYWPGRALQPWPNWEPQFREKPYLQYIFDDVLGFLAAWTWIIAVMPATLAILSIVFVETIFSAAGSTEGNGGLLHKLLSILILLAMTAANSISTKASTRLNSFFVGTKFISILAIAAAGLAVVVVQLSNPDREIGGRDWYRKSWFDYRDTVDPSGHRTNWGELNAWEILGYLSAALYGALWAYSGWDKAIYVSEELSSPNRQLPLAINTAIPTVILCFIVANAAYYVLLPWDSISTTDSVAVTSIARLLGPAAGIVAAALDLVPPFFTVIGRVGFGSRIEGDQLPNAAEGDSDAPLNALILSAILSSLYILLGNFRALLLFNGLGEYTFFFIAVLGVVLLRFKQPDLVRPYKPPF
ncbi:unnamed protein product [Parascedosporium putredinis]|uniref:LysM domain-containing protein n=1 Tax=Parascedosporium putredinis TaxID=1442378 RepID=A0A9P1H447_9PEZI|nr:unnamed protein product [Parascedosporium putredinis]CAI7996377.1 unnamed protein product [Parascedosporium putredinis]